MAVNIGDPLWPGTSQFPNTNFVYPGQGEQPLVNVLYTVDPVSDSTPAWIDITARVRSWSSSRGRDNEQSEFNAGTAQVKIDNRDRAFDSTYSSSPYYPNIRPLNRLWIREQFNGATNSVFKGYVERIHQQFIPPGMSDVVASISAVDEFKRLGLERLPLMDPPEATSYDQVVAFDNPAVYYRWSDRLLMTTTITWEWVPPQEIDTEIFFHGRMQHLHYTREGHFERIVVTSGQGWQSTGSVNWSMVTDSPIVGELIQTPDDTTQNAGAIQIAQNATLVSTDASAGDMGGWARGSVELWFKRGVTLPIANTDFWNGPGAANFVGTPLWKWTLNTGGTVTFTVKDASGGAQSVTSGTLNSGQWYHLVAVRDGTNLVLYVNGAQVASTASGTGWDWGSTTVAMSLNGSATSGVAINLDEMAVYPSKALSASRVLAHYDAAVNRGYAFEAPDVRIGNVLDSIHSQAPRRFRASGHLTDDAFMAGLPPMDLIRAAVRCELPEGMFFVSKDGTLVFLDADHRSVAPWNTVQTIFGDEGMEHVPAEFPMLDFDTDYSDSYITNTVKARKMRRDAVTQVATDATSISNYGERAVELQVPVYLNSESASIATAILAKYKDPMLRGISVQLTTDDPNVTDEVFKRDIGDRIRVIRTWPGGRGFFDQQMFIQKIEISSGGGGDYPDQKPWQIDLTVSPL